MASRFETPLYLDTQILSETIRRVDGVLAAQGQTLGADHRASIIAILYERFLRYGGRVDPETVKTHIKLMT